MNEAIILAGGFGTRLQSVVSQVPKPMAPVAGKPFLNYLLDRLIEQDYDHIVLATGYLHQVVSDYYGSRYRDADISYAVEHSPLGTGGAIVNALQYCHEQRVTVLNGDTLFDIDHRSFILASDASECHVSLAARRVVDAGRYGALEVDATGRVTAFREKQPQNASTPGLINGGIYRIDRTLLDGYSVGEPFSFERDVLQPLKFPVYAVPSEAYFIDIGIPDDYNRAQTELPAL